MPGNRKTKRQREIMHYLIEQGIADGAWLDITQLMSILPSVGTRQSVLCSLGYLIGGGFLERVYETRRGRHRGIYVPTPLGMSTFRGKYKP